MGDRLEPASRLIAVKREGRPRDTRGIVSEYAKFDDSPKDIFETGGTFAPSSTVVAVRRGRCHAPAMARKGGIEALMQVVSAEWCLGSVMHDDGEVSAVTELIPRTGTVSADQFVDWVFQVSSREARDPAPVWQRARAAIRAAFVEHMGGETVDASALRWDQVDVLGRPMLPLPDPEAFARNLTDEELEDEMNAREDWRDRLIAERELERRRRPAGWILWAFYGAALLLLLLLSRAWFWA